MEAMDFRHPVPSAPPAGLAPASHFEEAAAAIAREQSVEGGDGGKDGEDVPGFVVKAEEDGAGDAEGDVESEFCFPPLSATSMSVG